MIYPRLAEESGVVPPQPGTATSANNMNPSSNLNGSLSNPGIVITMKNGGGGAGGVYPQYSVTPHLRAPSPQTMAYGQPLTVATMGNPSPNDTREMEMMFATKRSGMSSFIADPEVDKIELYSYAQFVDEIESQGILGAGAAGKMSRKSTHRSKKNSKTERPLKSLRAPKIPHLSQLFVESSLQAQAQMRKMEREKRLQKQSQQPQAKNSSGFLQHQHSLQQNSLSGGGKQILPRGSEQAKNEDLIQRSSSIIEDYQQKRVSGNGTMVYRNDQIQKHNTIGPNLLPGGVKDFSRTQSSFPSAKSSKKFAKNSEESPDRQQQHLFGGINENNIPGAYGSFNGRNSPQFYDSLKLGQTIQGEHIQDMINNPNISISQQQQQQDYHQLSDRKNNQRLTTSNKDDETIGFIASHNNFADYGPSNATPVGNTRGVDNQLQLNSSPNIPAPNGYQYSNATPINSETLPTPGSVGHQETQLLFSNQHHPLQHINSMPPYTLGGSPFMNSNLPQNAKIGGSQGQLIQANYSSQQYQSVQSHVPMLQQTEPDEGFETMGSQGNGGGGGVTEQEYLKTGASLLLKQGDGQGHDDIVYSNNQEEEEEEDNEEWGDKSRNMQELDNSNEEGDDNEFDDMQREGNQIGQHLQRASKVGGLGASTKSDQLKASISGPSKSNANNDDDDDDDDYEDEGQKFRSMSTLKRQKTMMEKQESKRRKAAQFMEAQRLRNLKRYDYFIILPDDHFKKKWDLLITFLLLFTAIMSPYRIAFVDYDSLSWVIIETGTDIIFALDMILNFFFAFYDNQDEVIDERKKIATAYLKGWFFIDFFTILPISQIMNTTDYGNLARIARLPKLYRLIKILRLMRILKVVKERQMLIKYVNEVLRLNAGFERLIFFLIMSIVVCHICCCFWVILANLYKDSEDFIDTWLVRLNYQDESDYVVYIASMYFVLTTFTTVGFGDINGVTIPERVFCVILMLVGAVAFSFAVSSLSSMLSAIDTRSAQLRERMATLNQIKRQYRLSFELSRKLKSALKYDYSKSSQKQFSILNELPQNLKIELALLMNKEIIKKVFFFRNKPPYFIAFVGPLLKPIRIEADNFIYREGDPIEEIFFLTRGKAAFVSQMLDELPYMIIEAGYYFGEIDFVYHSYMKSQKQSGKHNFHMLNQVKISEICQNEEDFKMKAFQQINPVVDVEDEQEKQTTVLKRFFPVKAIENCDLLTLSKSDLARVEAEYEEIVAEMFVNFKKKIRKILRIKDVTEQAYLKKQIEQQKYNKEAGVQPAASTGILPAAAKGRKSYNMHNATVLEGLTQSTDAMVPMGPMRRMATSIYGQGKEGGPSNDGVPAQNDQRQTLIPIDEEDEESVCGASSEHIKTDSSFAEENEDEMRQDSHAQYNNDYEDRSGTPYRNQQTNNMQSSDQNQLSQINSYHEMDRVDLQLRQPPSQSQVLKEVEEQRDDIPVREDQSSFREDDESEQHNDNNQEVGGQQKVHQSMDRIESPRESNSFIEDEDDDEDEEEYKVLQQHHNPAEQEGNAHMHTPNHNPDHQYNNGWMGTFSGERASQPGSTSPSAGRSDGNNALPRLNFFNQNNNANYPNQRTPVGAADYQNVLPQASPTRETDRATNNTVQNMGGAGGGADKRGRRRRSPPKSKVSSELLLSVGGSSNAGGPALLSNQQQQNQLQQLSQQRSNPSFIGQEEQKQENSGNLFRRTNTQHNFKSGNPVVTPTNVNGRCGNKDVRAQYHQMAKQMQANISGSRKIGQGAPPIHISLSSDMDSITQLNNNHTASFLLGSNNNTTNNNQTHSTASVNGVNVHFNQNYLINEVIGSLLDYSKVNQTAKQKLMENIQKQKEQMMKYTNALQTIQQSVGEVQLQTFGIPMEMFMLPSPSVLGLTEDLTQQHIQNLLQIQQQVYQISAQLQQQLIQPTFPPPFIPQPPQIQQQIPNNPPSSGGSVRIQNEQPGAAVVSTLPPPQPQQIPSSQSFQQLDPQLQRQQMQMQVGFWLLMLENKNQWLNCLQQMLVQIGESQQTSIAAAQEGALEAQLAVAQRMNVGSHGLQLGANISSLSVPCLPGGGGGSNSANNRGSGQDNSNRDNNLSPQGGGAGVSSGPSFITTPLATQIIMMQNNNVQQPVQAQQQNISNIPTNKVAPQVAAAPSGNGGQICFNNRGN